MVQKAKVSRAERMLDEAKQSAGLTGNRAVIRRFFVKCESCGARYIARLSGKATSTQYLYEELQLDLKHQELSE